MIRRDAILFILANIGSILGDFSTPEIRHKSGILNHRGVPAVENVTTIRAKWVQAWEPTFAKPERIRQNIPDGDEKSKMLENLRAMQPTTTPNDEYFNPTTPGYGDGYPPYRTTPPSDIIVEDPTMPRNTTLPMSSNLTKTDNGTCNWLNWQDRQQRVGLESLKKLKKEAEEELNIENVGEKLHNIWKCMHRKYLISRDQIKKKLCRWFGVRVTTIRPRHSRRTTTQTTRVRRLRSTTTTTTTTTEPTRRTRSTSTTTTVLTRRRRTRSTAAVI